MQKLASLLSKLRFVPGFAFAVDATYLAFLDRVSEGELRLRAVGLWDVPHPWLNLFVPKSAMQVFESGVFKGILKANNSPGPVLIYPMNKNKYKSLYLQTAAANFIGKRFNLSIGTVP